LHLYQRLHSAGWPHAAVTVLYLLQITLLALGFCLGLPLPIMFGEVLMVLMLGWWLDQNQASAFSGENEK
jgi:uncharacterized membrane protein YczE